MVNRVCRGLQHWVASESASSCSIFDLSTQWWGYSTAVPHHRSPPLISRSSGLHQASCKRQLQSNRKSPLKANISTAQVQTASNTCAVPLPDPPHALPTTPTPTRTAAASHLLAEPAPVSQPRYQQLFQPLAAAAAPALQQPAATALL